MNLTRLIFFAILTCDLAAVSWGAVILPPATSSTLCEGISPNPIQDPFACTIAGGASGSVQEAPSVLLVSHAAVPSPGVTSQALTDLQYFFEVVGGRPGDLVPVLIETSLATVAAGQEAFAAANIQVRTTSQVPTVVATCTDGSCPFGTDFSGTFSVNAVSGQVASVLLVTQAAVGGLFGGTADASADPVIFIDPSFAGAANYLVVVSDGVGNSSSLVPEPSNFSLLGIGLATLGWRRRRKVTLDRMKPPSAPIPVPPR